MNTNISYPKVLLVGRTNVGKSTLFNRLSQQKRSIVFEREGVTRDYVEELIEWNDKAFLLVDTGGLTFDKNPDEIGKRVQENVLNLLSQAELLLFVVDAKNGLVEEDMRIISILRKVKRPLFLLINKCDNQKAFEENLPDFYTLGIDKIIPVSGVHGTGIADLLKEVAYTVRAPEETEKVAPSYKVVLIGRPNVGKSSLMNLLIDRERSIVSNVAGTTREAISEMTYHLNDLVQITDTAGVRRPRKVDDDLEVLMVKNSLQAVKDADIVVLMIDASEGKIADQELKLLFYAYEQKKMILVVFNKIDLLNEYTSMTLEQSVLEYQFILKKLPQVWTSCVTEKNVDKIFNEIQGIWQRCTQHFDDAEIEETIKSNLAKVHLYHTQQQLKVRRAYVAKNAHVPTFVLRVNYPQWFGTSEQSCVENILRKNYDLLGCPVAFVIKEGR